MADYSDYTNEELEDELRSRGLPTSGNKAVKISRLQAADAGTATPTVAPAAAEAQMAGEHTPDQIAYADDPATANAPQQASTDLAESTQATLDAAAEHPMTGNYGDPDEDGTPAGNRHVQREHAIGYKIGQVLPPEPEEDENIAARAEAYFSGRSECPYCHVPDGVREGQEHCDSCGARWTSKEGAAATQ